MSERNQYFPNLFEPLKIGSKTVKNRIEAAPAMFAFEHFMEGDDPFGYTQPVNEKAYRMLEAKAKVEQESSVLEKSVQITNTIKDFHLNHM